MFRHLYVAITLLCAWMIFTPPALASSQDSTDLMVSCMDADENNAALAAVRACSETGMMADAEFKSAPTLKLKQFAALAGAAAYITAGDNAVVGAGSFAKMHDLKATRNFLILARTYFYSEIRCDQWLGTNASTDSGRNKFQDGATIAHRKIATVSEFLAKIP